MYRPPVCRHCLGFSSNNSVAGTVADTTTYGVMALYSFGAPKIYAGYEHIKFANPDHPLEAGFRYRWLHPRLREQYRLHQQQESEVIWVGGKYALHV